MGICTQTEVHESIPLDEFSQTAHIHEIPAQIKNIPYLTP